MSTIKAKINVSFPAAVTVQSPLILTQSGRVYEFSLDVPAVLGGDITVFQLRVALRSAGYFDDVDNHSNFAVDPGGKIYEAWTNGGVRTSYADALSDAIADIIGAAPTQAAYAAATAVTL